MSRRRKQLARTIKSGYRIGLSPALMPVSSPAQLFAEAQDEQRAGNLARAEELFRAILTVHPNHAWSVHFLGTIAYQRQQMEAAAQAMRRSIELDEAQGSFHSNYGLVLQALGRLDAAAEEYTRAIALQPASAEAYNNLANVRQEQKRWDEAATLYAHALRLRPEYVEALSNLGVVYKAKGKIVEAIALYERALQLRPTHTDALYNLANALSAQDRPDEAIVLYRRALELEPNSHALGSHRVKTCVNLANALTAQSRPDEAIALYRRALEQEPNSRALEPHRVKIWVNWANTLVDKGEVEEALPFYGRALAMGDEARITGQENEAMQREMEGARFNLGLTKLLLGKLAEGLPLYDSRPRETVFWRSGTTASAWQGEPLQERRILLHAEQGLGDSLHLLRYVPMVKAAGGKVILQIQPTLRRLAEQIEGITVIAEGDAQPSFDVHCPLMSLPLAFGTTLETIPAGAPYLSVPAEERRRAAEYPWPPSDVLRIGLVWAGGPAHVKDRLRSLRFDQIEPLLRVEGARFFSLQLGLPAAQLSLDHPKVGTLPLRAENMAETAAMIEHLDLVIAADTAVAHLAGALGKPVWMMLPYAPDWRWLLHREDSPWYPTMRLFRQTKPGDWDGVVERVGEALRGLAGQDRADRLSCVADDLVSSP